MACFYQDNAENTMAKLNCNNHVASILLIIKIASNYWLTLASFQTHTQAERKILESKKDLLLKEISRANSLDVSILKDRLIKLESEKPHPYGTFQAVSSHSSMPIFHPECLCWILVLKLFSREMKGAVGEWYRSFKKTKNIKQYNMPVWVSCSP